MATTFVIACPKCSKQVKVSEQHVGKKIRCKECGDVYPVKAPSDGPLPAPKPEKKPVDDDDDDGRKDYGVVKDESTLPRCPFCAMELASLDARICLNCGYDTVKRTRPEVKQVYAHTALELILWWMPGILAVLFIIGMIVWYVIFWGLIEGWMADSWFEDEKGPPTTYIAAASPAFFRFYHGLLVAFIGFKLSMIAYKRLVVNNKPREQRIKDDF